MGESSFLVVGRVTEGDSKRERGHERSGRVGPFKLLAREVRSLPPWDAGCFFDRTFPVGLLPPTRIAGLLVELVSTQFSLHSGSLQQFLESPQSGANRLSLVNANPQSHSISFKMRRRLMAQWGDRHGRFDNLHDFRPRSVRTACTDPSPSGGRTCRFFVHADPRVWLLPRRGPCTRRPRLASSSYRTQPIGRTSEVAPSPSSCWSAAWPGLSHLSAS